jgi:methionyl aminopeptidase
MTVETEQDLQALKEIGRVCALAVQAMGEAIQPGITTRELDQIGARVLADHRAQSAPILTYDYPGATCISINEEAAHGIPGDRVIVEGDLVNVDVSAELDGYFADHAWTYPVGTVSVEAKRLCEVTEATMWKAISAARAGRPVNTIGRTVEANARRAGYSVIVDLPGHGVGRSLHEPPTVLNFYQPRLTDQLTDGMVITIEPFLSVGRSQHIEELDDGWTLVTTDRALCAQYEHTLVVTKKRPLIITAL